MFLQSIRRIPFVYCVKGLFNEVTRNGFRYGTLYLHKQQEAECNSSHRDPSWSLQKFGGWEDGVLLGLNRFRGMPGIVNGALVVKRFGRLMGWRTFHSLWNSIGNGETAWVLIFTFIARAPWRNGIVVAYSTTRAPAWTLPIKAGKQWETKAIFQTITQIQSSLATYRREVGADQGEARANKFATINQTNGLAVELANMFIWTKKRDD